MLSLTKNSILLCRCIQKCTSYVGFVRRTDILINTINSGIDSDAGADQKRFYTPKTKFNTFVSARTQMCSRLNWLGARWKICLHTVPSIRYRRAVQMSVEAYFTAVTEASVKKSCEN